jgi:hypothetical protein
VGAVGAANDMITMESRLYTHAIYLSPDPFDITPRIDLKTGSWIIRPSYNFLP